MASDKIARRQDINSFAAIRIGADSAQLKFQGRGGSMSGTDFSETVTPYIGALRATAMQWGPDGADDLVQDTLLRAYQRWHLFRGGAVLSWLHVVLRNVAINRYHRVRRRGEVTLDTTHPDMPSALPTPSAPDAASVRRAVADLPPEFRQVVELVSLRGMRYQDAAEVLDVPVGTVMSRLHRARRRLREPLRNVARSEYGLRAD